MSLDERTDGLTNLYTDGSTHGRDHTPTTEPPENIMTLAPVGGGSE